MYELVVGSQSSLRIVRIYPKYVKDHLQQKLIINSVIRVAIGGLFQIDILHISDLLIKLYVFIHIFTRVISLTTLKFEQIIGKIYFFLIELCMKVDPLPAL